MVISILQFKQHNWIVRIKNPKSLNLRTKDSATDERTKQLFLLNIKPKYKRQVFSTQTGHLGYDTV